MGEEGIALRALHHRRQIDAEAKENGSRRQKRILRQLHGLRRGTREAVGIAARPLRDHADRLRREIRVVRARPHHRHALAPIRGAWGWRLLLRGEHPPLRKIGRVVGAHLVLVREGDVDVVGFGVVDGRVRQSALRVHGVTQAKVQRRERGRDCPQALRAHKVLGGVDLAARGIGGDAQEAPIVHLEQVRPEAGDDVVGSVFDNGDALAAIVVIRRVDVTVERRQVEGTVPRRHSGDQAVRGEVEHLHLARRRRGRAAIVGDVQLIVHHHHAERRVAGAEARHMGKVIRAENVDGVRIAVGDVEQRVRADRRVVVGDVVRRFALLVRRGDAHLVDHPVHAEWEGIDDFHDKGQNITLPRRERADAHRVVAPRGVRPPAADVGRVVRQSLG